MGSTTPSSDSAAFQLNAVGLTDLGRVRARNEDAFRIDTATGIHVVADGMGGHRCGDLASRLAVRLLPQVFSEQCGSSAAPVDAADRVATIFAQSITEVSHRIHAAGRSQIECHGMGTTLVAALIEKSVAHIAHIGDSRAYLLRDGVLHQLTQDHSVVGALLRLGELTPEEAWDHPAQSQLTSFVGIGSRVRPDVMTLRLRPRDRLLLCSDGVWSTVEPDALRSILADASTPRAACRQLIARGNAAGGHDNLTALVIDCQPPARKTDRRRAADAASRPRPPRGPTTGAASKP